MSPSTVFFTPIAVQKMPIEFQPAAANKEMGHGHKLQIKQLTKQTLLFYERYPQPARAPAYCSGMPSVKLAVTEYHTSDGPLRHRGVAISTTAHPTKSDGCVFTDATLGYGCIIEPAVKFQVYIYFSRFV